MASFTYTVWSDASRDELLRQLQSVFCGLGFDLINNKSGKIHLWNDDGEIKIDAANSEFLNEIRLPVGMQWWRGDDDVYVSIDKSSNALGYICRVTLVGMSRNEQAEVARLIILHVTPDKQKFPDDFYVFRLSAE